MAASSVQAAAEPPANCPRCERLAAFRADWRAREPGWHNAPVATFADSRGDDHVRLLIVGLAPGLRGANRNGRPFTGDHAGDLLYATLQEFGFAQGAYAADPRDGLRLAGCAITNAVRCVPPENKPTGAEIGNCRPFLAATLERFRNLRCVLTLGRIAHDSAVRTLGEKPARAPFSHGGCTQLCDLTLVSSYHCSRYNTNTGRLTPAMFRSVFLEIVQILG